MPRALRKVTLRHHALKHYEILSRRIERGIRVPSNGGLKINIGHWPNNINGFFNGFRRTRSKGTMTLKLALSKQRVAWEREDLKSELRRKEILLEKVPEKAPKVLSSKEPRFSATQKTGFSSKLY